MEAALNACENFCWILEHEQIYTNGTDNTDSNVVQTNRGGGSIYHGPGQCVIYFAAQLNKLNFNDVHELIVFLEDCIYKIALDNGLEAIKRVNGPGVWLQTEMGLKKNAFIGLRVNKNNWVSHGMAVNLNCDLDKFDCINVCGKECTVGNMGLDKKHFIDSLLVLFKKQFSFELVD